MGGTPETMAAAVLRGPGRIELTKVAVRPLAEDEVRAAVTLCGICGSDLHMALEGWGQRGTWLGHEWVGEVVEVGPAVTRWRVGDQVVGGPPRGCGTCAMCATGRSSLCADRDSPGRGDGEGAFATFKVAGEDELFAAPDGLDPRAAALAEPLAVALHAITRSGVRPGQSAMVLGAGPIGALAVAALRAMGVDEVSCVEPNPARLALAGRAGATRLLRPDELEVPSIAEPGRVVDGAVDVALECSGKASAMEAALAQVVRSGTVVLVGAGIEPPRLDPNRIILNEVSVTGAFNYDPDGFPTALDLLASGLLPAEDLLEPGTVGLAGLLDAMVALAEGRLTGKVLVSP